MGKARFVVTDDIGTLTVEAVIVCEPRWTETPLRNSATYHSMVIAGALGQVEDKSRWKRRVVESRILPEICVSPASAPLNRALKIRNDLVVSTEVIVTFRVVVSATSVATLFCTLGPAGVEVPVASENWSENTAYQHP